MLRTEKKQVVAELEEVYKKSSSVIITHYHGLTVKEVTNLRSSLRVNSASFMVVKNTLAKIAAENAKINFDPQMFSGPTAIAHSEDPVGAAKSVVEFAKSNDSLKIIGAIVNDKVLTVDEIKVLATLPSLDEIRSKIVGVLQAPSSNIARVLQAPSSGLARVLQAYSEKN